MNADFPRPRPLRNVTATGTALAVALGPLVVGALLARSVGGDPMVSVNALIAGGGQRARISRAQLRGCGGRAVTRARRATANGRVRAVQSTGLRAIRKPWGVASSGPAARTRRADSTSPAAVRYPATRSGDRR